MLKNVIKMKFLATDLHTFYVLNQQNGLSLTLKFRSKLKTLLISLGMISYTLSILIYALKPIVKKLLSIEIVIFYTFPLSEA
jgi:hypothetical protein